MNQMATTWSRHSVTSAKYDTAVDNNGSWSEAFQFGDPDDLSWTLTGCSFELDIQRNPYDTVPLLQLNTGNGRIIIDDVIQRVIHFDVLAADIQLALHPGTYCYDLIMLDANGVRTPLMHGALTIQQGVTYP